MNVHRRLSIAAAGLLTLGTMAVVAPAASARPDAGVAPCVSHTDAVNSARAAAGGNRRDANELSAAQVKAMEATFAKVAAAKGIGSGERGKPGGGGTGTFTPVTVKVYMHVITDGAKGNLSSSMIANQVSVLNNAYAGSGFSFTLAGTDYTNNAGWYNNLTDGTAAEKAMKTALRQGTKADLNLYSASLGGGLLGSTTPSRAAVMARATMSPTPPPRNPRPMAARPAATHARARPARTRSPTSWTTPTMPA